MAKREYKVKKGENPEMLATRWLKEQGIEDPTKDEVDAYKLQIIEAAKANKAYNDDEGAKWLLAGHSFDIPDYTPPVATKRQPIPTGWSWRATDAPVTNFFEAADEKKLREQSNKYLDKWVSENYGKEYMPSEEDYNAFYAMMLNKNGQKKSGTFFTPALEKYQIPYQSIAPEGGMSVASVGTPMINGGEQKAEEVVVGQQGGDKQVVTPEQGGGQQSSSTGIDWLDNAMRAAEKGTDNQGGDKQGGEKTEPRSTTAGQGASSATFTPTTYPTTTRTSYADRFRQAQALRGNEGGGAATSVAQSADTNAPTYYPEIVENPDNILDVWYNRSNAAAQRRANIQQEIQNWLGRGESAKQAMLKAMEPQKNEEKEKRLRDTTKMQAITDFLTALATGVIGAESKNYAPQTPANAQQYAVNLANLQQLNEARDEKYRQLKGQMDYQQWQQEGEALAKMDAEAAKDAREADRLIGNYFISELRGENSLENMLTQRELSLWSKLREDGYYQGDFEAWGKLSNDEKNKVIDKANKAEEAARRSGGGSGSGTSKGPLVGSYQVYIPNSITMKDSIPSLYAELVKVGATPRKGKIKVDYGYYQTEKDGEVAPTDNTEFFAWLKDNIDNEAVRKYLQRLGFKFNKI